MAHGQRLHACLDPLVLPLERLLVLLAEGQLNLARLRFEDKERVVLILDLLD